MRNRPIIAIVAGDKQHTIPVYPSPSPTAGIPTDLSAMEARTPSQPIAGVSADTRKANGQFLVTTFGFRF